MSSVATMNSVVEHKPRSLVARTAERFAVEPEKLLGTLKATCFRGDVSNEQLMALLVVADQFNLNPFTKEIYAFPDKRNGIIPVVGVDGWSRIINEHPQFDGMDFKDGPSDEKGLPEWIECTMYRKDRSHSVTAREYMVECYREPFVKDGKPIDGPWQSHPRRFLRHKSLIQCARIAFGFTGIYDPDEGERIVAATANQADLGPRADITSVDPALCDRWIGDITDILNQDKEEINIAEDLRQANAEISKFPELAQSVFDGLAERGIIKKGKYRDYLKVGL
jgi:phage recombination protein Bet